MRAGLLKYVVIFKELRTVKSPTGAVSKEYVPVYRCRAEKKKFSVASDGDKVDAKEEFYGHLGVLRVRYSPRINEMQIVEFRGTDYKIDLLDPQPGNTYLVHIHKINK